MSTRKSFDNEAARAIGRRIKEARGETTQSEFADLIGVDRATLSNYETGRRTPNAEIIKNIELITGIGENYILLGSSDASDYVASGIKKYQNEFVKLSQREPGFYPKWFFSDFEVAMLRCFRACSDKVKHSIVKSIADDYQRLEEALQVPFGEHAEPFEQESLRLITAALNDGEFKRGTDVEMVLWGYFKRMRFADGGPDGEGAQ